MVKVAVLIVFLVAISMANVQAFVFDIFGMHNPALNMMGQINQMIHNIHQASAHMAFDNLYPGPGKPIVHSQHLKPGDRKFFKNGNTRGYTFRSNDGRSNGFVFSSGTGSGSGFTASFGPDGTTHFDNFFF